MQILKKTALTLLLLSATAGVSAQRLTREEYILRYKHLAAGTMERYGIPASIVMAQAILESDNGNSRLAREGNNHFGIKCGSGWRGETLSHSDDAADDCFRVYGSIEESFLDHGAFLDGSARYDRLFDLPEDDYAAWAHGLRECGYATNPDYGSLLIRIIETNNLFLLDRPERVDAVAYNDIRTEVREVEIDGSSEKISVDDYTVLIDRTTGRELFYNNGIPFVEARVGDSFASIARDFGLTARRLLRFNDLTREIALRPGEALYIQRKGARAAESAPRTVIAHPGETMHALSQQYGIRLKKLYRLNRLAPGTPLHEGQPIRLR